MNEKFTRAKTTYDSMIEESMQRYSQPVYAAPPQQQQYAQAAPPQQQQQQYSTQQQQNQADAEAMAGWTPEQRREYDAQWAAYHAATQQYYAQQQQVSPIPSPSERVGTDESLGVVLRSARTTGTAGISATRRSAGDALCDSGSCSSAAAAARSSRSSSYRPAAASSGASLLPSPSLVTRLLRRHDCSTTNSISNNKLHQPKSLKPLSLLLNRPLSPSNTPSQHPPPIPLLLSPTGTRPPNNGSGLNNLPPLPSPTSTQTSPPLPPLINTLNHHPQQLNPLLQLSNPSLPTRQLNPRTLS